MVWHWCKCCCHTLDCVSQRNWYLQNSSGDLTSFNCFGFSLENSQMCGGNCKILLYISLYCKTFLSFRIWYLEALRTVFYTNICTIFPLPLSPAWWVLSSYCWSFITELSIYNHNHLFWRYFLNVVCTLFLQVFLNQSCN